MGFRFRKTIGLIPGLRLNLSKSGVSASVGGKGATVNIGTKGVTGTVGLPGSGLSYRKSLTPTGLELARKGRWGKWWLLALVAAAALALFYARRELPKLAQSPAPAEVPIAVNPAAGTAVVSSATATCRESPGRAGKVALKLGRGDIVTVSERRGAWTQIRTGAFDCWLSSRTVKLG